MAFASPAVVRGCRKPTPHFGAERGGVAGGAQAAGDAFRHGIADPALYRDGQWFIETGETYAWGESSDIPLSLPYAIRSSLP